MKMLITEKQLSSILRKKKQMRKDVEEAADITSTSSSSSSSATATSPSTTSTTSTTDTGTGEPTGKGQMDFPAYPEVDHADDIVKRGVANPVDYTKKHEDYPEANPVRGRANPIKGM